jgi:hypothetical protein
MRCCNLIALLGAALLAGCSAPFAPPPPSAQTPGASAPAPTEAPTAGAAPSPAAGAGVELSELGVALSLPPDLATSARVEQVPAQGVGDPQAPYWGVLPEHRRVVLEGYPQQPGAPPAAIAIFPVEAYGAASAPAQEAIQQLSDLLAAQPAAPEQIPVLPLLNAAQVTRAQVRYLGAAGGPGVRFVAAYAQNVAPVDHSVLLYIYQGVSGDGRFVISALLPVSAPQPDPAAGEPAFPTPDATGGIDPGAYASYVTGVAQRLDALPPEDFTPSLADLDALLGSVRLE